MAKEDWPVYCPDALSLGNMESPVAICSLWTKQENLTRMLESATYCVIGNLYSRDGINFLIRNILANPQIRFLVVCGRDRTHSGETVYKLFRYGLDSEHRVVEDGTPVDLEVNGEAIDLVRKSVELIDLRDRTEHDVADLIPSLDRRLPAFAPQPLIFPRRTAHCETFPSENNVFVIRGKFVAEVWLEALSKILLFGRITKTQHSIDQKELLNLVCIIEQEDPDRINWVDWFPFSRDDLEGRQPSPKILDQQLALFFIEECPGYYTHVLTPDSAPDLSYTYGERLFNYDDVNQIRGIIDELRKAAYSRRAVASLWHPKKDQASTSPPCLNLLQFEIRDEKLYLTAYIRSNDMYRAWPQNALALRKLQKLVAAEIGTRDMGDTVTISNSAHLYEDTWELAKAVVSKHYGEVRLARRRDGRDPRGNFAIRNEDGEIIVEHYSSDGRHLGTTIGKTARDVSKELLKYVSTLEHALYLGMELQKAEMALRCSITYTQDRPLKFGRARFSDR